MTQLTEIIDVFLPAARAAYQPSGAGIPSGFVETGRLYSTAVRQDFGFVAFNATTETALVAIRGTEDFEDWLRDLDAIPASFEGSFVHQGFLTAYNAIRDGVLRWINTLLPKSIWISGHSMGGALAIPCASELQSSGLNPVVVTFAAPRFGDPRFAGSFNKAIAECVRVANTGDLVPLLPTCPPYQHVGKELAVDGGFRVFDPKFAHSLDQYEVGLRKLSTVPPPQ